MKAHRFLLMAAATLLLATPLIFAHHPLEAEYDDAKPITLTGTITKVEWKNPHVRLHLDGTSGRLPSSMDWEVEMASPGLLALSGLKMTNLRPGDHLIVNAYPARDGSNSAYAKKVTRERR